MTDYFKKEREEERKRLRNEIIKHVRELRKEQKKRTGCDGMSDIKLIDEIMKVIIDKNNYHKVVMLDGYWAP